MTCSNRVLALIVSITASSLCAGPLNPPAGAVAPTAKPLAEIEPRRAINAANTPGDADSLYRISQPGSYYLTGNITGVSGRHGIEIAASGVTIDLNGFEMYGGDFLIGTPASLDGIATTVSGLTGITIHNGSIRNWGRSGVDLGTAEATRCRLFDLRSNSNSVQGLRVGDDASVSNCTAGDNGSTGISASAGCVITGCSSGGNDGGGFFAGSSSTLTACTAYDNTDVGINAATGCTVTACTAYDNEDHGFSGANGSTFTGCAAYFNGGRGFSFATGLIAGCTATNNAGDGINASLNASIVSNSSSNNDGAGIRATGSRNRIEGNNCTSNDRGVLVTAAGNIIVRNTCGANTVNWDVVAGNTILVVNASAAGAVVGNTGGAAPGSTDPNANFTY